MARKPVTRAEAAAAADPAPSGDPAITDETVVVTGEDVQPVAAAEATPTDPAPEPAAAEPPQAGGLRTDVVVVTCGIAAGRRRAGRRWDAGTTRVPAAEISDAQLAELHADPVLRVSIEAA